MIIPWSLPSIRFVELDLQLVNKLHCTMNVFVFVVLAVILAASSQHSNALEEHNDQLTDPILRNKSEGGISSRQISRFFYVETTLMAIRQEVNRRTLKPQDRKKILNTIETSFNLLNPNLNTYSTLSRPPADALLLLRNFRSNNQTLTMPPFSFHVQLTRLYTKLNDGHTVYLPPHPLRSAFAFAGFYMVPYWKPSGQRSFIFSTQGDVRSVMDPNFKKGVEILKIDGAPALSEAKRLGRLDYTSGDTDDNKIRSGALYITSRPVTAEIPKKPALSVLYVDLSGKRRTISIPWKYYVSPFEFLQGANVTTEDEENGLSKEVPVMSDVSNEHPQFNSTGRLILDHKFAPMLKVNSHSALLEYRRVQALSELGMPKTISSSSVLDSEGLLDTSSKQAGNKITFKPIRINSRFSSDLLAVKITIRSASGQFDSIGYIGLFSFTFAIEPQDVEAFVNEMTRVLRLLPSKKLILDLRGNRGGYAANVDTIFRILVGYRNVAYPIAMRANSLTSFFFGDTAVTKQYTRSGEFLTSYISDLIFWPPLARLSIPTAFKGRLALLVDSSTASAGDLFAAVCKEHVDIFTGGRTIPIIGTDRATAGAGATVIDVDQSLTIAAASGQIKRNYSIQRLGVIITTSFLRFNRALGGLVEHFGVNVDFWYKETKRDILQNNVDLVVYANRLLNRALPPLSPF